MNRKKFFILGSCVLCIAFFSCNHEDAYYNPDVVKVDKNDGYTDSISLQYVKDLPSISEGISCIDNYLILTQNNKDSVFLVMDINSGSFIASFGKVGHARNEFHITPRRVYCIRNEKGEPILCIQDDACTKVVDIKKSVKANNCVISKIIKEKKDYLFDHTYHFAVDKCFNYKTVSYEDARDAIYIKPMFYMNNNTDNEWNIFPQIITPIFSNVVNCAYSMRMLVSPNGKYAVGIHNFIDIVTIFDISENESIGIINPNSYTLRDMESDFNKDNINEKLIWYNTSGCATDHSFMVIKNGDLYRNVAYNDGEEGSSVINWYDWSGEKRASYIANKRLGNIVYHEETGVLYAISYANKLYSCKLRNK